jgi:hypothetical protein
MARVPRFAFVAAVLLAAGVAGGGVSKAGEPGPGAAPAKAMREVWVLETGRGKQHQRKEFDVTSMTEDERRETLQTLTDLGWKLVEKRRTEVGADVVGKPPEVVVKKPEVVVKPPEIVVVEDDDEKPVKVRPAPPAPKAGGDDEVERLRAEIEKTRRELESLREESDRIEHEMGKKAPGTDDSTQGRALAEGLKRLRRLRAFEGARKSGEEPAVGGTGMPFAPEMGAGMFRTFGRLLLKYLEDKKDPAKAAIYEEFLRDLAEAMVAAGSGREDAVQAAGAKVMAAILAAMQDPKKAEVMGEVMRSFTDDLAKDLRRSMESGEAEGDEAPEDPTSDTPTTSIRRIRIGGQDVHLGGAGVVERDGGWFVR